MPRYCPTPDFDFPRCGITTFIQIINQDFQRQWGEKYKCRTLQISHSLVLPVVDAEAPDAHSLATLLSTMFRCFSTQAANQPMTGQLSKKGFDGL